MGGEAGWITYQTLVLFIEMETEGPSEGEGERM